MKLHIHNGVSGVGDKISGIFAMYSILFYCYIRCFQGDRSINVSRLVINKGKNYGKHTSARLLSTSERRKHDTVPPQPATKIASYVVSQSLLI